MLRFDDCLCGTTTTGTGTLTLAAIPSGAGGGIDPDVWARATGVGFGNSAVLLVDYVLTEYTDSTFATEKNKEAGIGALTLGASAGIANATLARTTLDWTATSLNVQPASVAVKPGTGITIGTAANTLVMIAPRSLSLPAFSGYVDTTTTGDQLGILLPIQNSVGSAAVSYGLTALHDVYIPFTIFAPLLVKKASVRVQTAGVGNTGTQWGRIIDVGTDGRPGRCIVDFGQIGASGALATTGNISSTPLTNGVLLPPGDYFFDFICSSAVGSPGLTSPVSSGTGCGTVQMARTITQSGGVPISLYEATTGSAAALAPGTAANLTAYAWAGTNAVPLFWLSP